MGRNAQNKTPWNRTSLSSRSPRQGTLITPYCSWSILVSKVMLAAQPAFTLFAWMTQFELFVPIPRRDVSNISSKKGFTKMCTLCDSRWWSRVCTIGVCLDASCIDYKRTICWRRKGWQCEFCSGPAVHDKGWIRKSVINWPFTAISICT
jgi:hypothetical protein